MPDINRRPQNTRKAGRTRNLVTSSSSNRIPADDILHLQSIVASRYGETSLVDDDIEDEEEDEDDSCAPESSYIHTNSKDIIDSTCHEEGDEDNDEDDDLKLNTRSGRSIKRPRYDDELQSTAKYWERGNK